MKKYRLEEIAPEFAKPAGTKKPIEKMKPFNVGDTVDFEEIRPDSNQSGRFRRVIRADDYEKYLRDVENGILRVRGSNLNRRY